MDIKRRDWALASFIVGVLALVATIVTIFVNGVMNEEARDFAGLRRQRVLSTPADPVPATSTSGRTPTAVSEAAAMPSGTEFTILDDAPTLAKDEPRQRNDGRLNPKGRAEQQPRNGTRYELAALPSEVNDSVTLVLEEDQ